MAERGIVMLLREMLNAAPSFRKAEPPLKAAISISPRLLKHRASAFPSHLQLLLD